MTLRSEVKTRTVRHAVAVVVPAHNEEDMIERCLRSIERAAASLRVLGIDVSVHIVCDACSDTTPARCKALGVTPLEVNFRNVGSARAAGASAALAAGAEWLAFTDADTVVSQTWLIDQLALDADAFCGTVAVDEWGSYGTRMHEHFSATYCDADEHKHIHGANFGISASAYRATNGFLPLPSSEDVALVHALIAGNFRIAWSAVPRVTTSARREYRAPDGFGATLERVEAAFREAKAGTCGAMNELLPAPKALIG